MILHGYFRSAASWRVRIALNLKMVAVEHVSLHLRRGEQRSAAYQQINPQCLVPTLVTDEHDALTQSLAIIEWLDEIYPDPPLLAGSASWRARVRAFGLVLVADTHPLQNLRVLGDLRGLSIPEEAITAWAAEVNRTGLAACETLLQKEAGPFCFGISPTLADICLVPQLGNARRFGVDVSVFPALLAREATCGALEAFAAAAPHRQADAE